MFRQYSRYGLVLCLTVSLTLTGCASGWNRLIGKLKDQPSPQLTLAWAKLKEDENNLTEARQGYETVLAEEPNNVDAIMGMARLNVKVQRLVDAEQGFDRALALKPKSPEVLSDVGEFYAQLQRWDKSIPLMQEAQRIEPHEKRHQFKLGVVLTKAGRTSDALPHFIEAVGEAAAHYNVGRILIEAGKTTEAEAEFRLALTKDPTLTDAEFFLTEIRNKRSGQVVAQPILATAPSVTPPRQLPAHAAAGQPPMSAAIPGRDAARPPLYAHGGYEELPSPADSPNDAGLANSRGSASSVSQASGFSPAVSGGGPLVVPAAKGAQFRMSTTQQLPLR